MNPEMVVSVYASTVISVGIILAAVGFGSFLGWGMVASKYLESIARQPELRAQLMGQMLFTGGLMEALPFIALGIAMWFTTANPFAAAVVGLMEGG
jgi:F-type H+-transporting ATPase subunit c